MGKCFDEFLNNPSDLVDTSKNPEASQNLILWNSTQDYLSYNSNI